MVDLAARGHMLANRGDAAKEASDYIHKGLELALHNEVKEESIKNCRQKSKAVDFFLRRKERCDRFSKETIALSEEDKAKQAAEREAALRKEKKRQEETHVEVEQVACQPIKGEIKLPPMIINPKNNSNLAKPFSSSSTNGEVAGWASVAPASNNRLSNGCVDSLRDSMENSMLSTGASSNVFYEQFHQPNNKSYRPIAYMNFKPKSVGWREDGQHKNIRAAGENNVNEILDLVHKREQEQERAKAEAARASESDNQKTLRNGVGPVRLSKVSLNDNIGKWRPSTDNWRPGVNTDGFFKALGLQNQMKNKQ